MAARNVFQNAECLPQFFGSCVISQVEVEHNAAGRLARNILNGIVDDVGVGNGHLGAVERGEAETAQPDETHVAVVVGHTYAVANVERVVDEHGGAAQEVGHRVFGSQSQSHTAHAKSCQKRLHIVASI